MKKVVLLFTQWLLILLAEAVLLTSCSKQEEGAPDGMKSAAAEAADYFLYVPKDWQVDTAEGSLLTAAHVGDGDNSNITMMAYTNDLGLGSINEYWENYEKNLEKIFDLDVAGNSTYLLKNPGGVDEETGEPLPDGESDILGGEKCYSYRYTGTLGGVPLEYLQVITYHNGYFYLFTYTATTDSDRFSRHEEDVAMILQNFKFK